MTPEPTSPEPERPARPQPRREVQGEREVVHTTAGETRQVPRGGDEHRAQQIRQPRPSAHRAQPVQAPERRPEPELEMPPQRGHLYSPSRLSFHVRIRLTRLRQYGHVGIPKYCIRWVSFPDYFCFCAAGRSNGRPPSSARERFKSVAGAICVM